MRLTSLALFLTLFTCNALWAQAPEERLRIRTDIKALTRSDEKDTKKLALALGKIALNEKAQPYAIYAWLTEKVAYDAEELKRATPGRVLDPNSPEARRFDRQRAQPVLDSRIALCQGYAQLAVALFDELGFYSYMVPGYARRSTDGESKYRFANHAWVAVRGLDGWLLMDPTWGAGFLTEDNRFNSKPSDEWFAPNPTAFALSHHPTDPAFQLLGTPQTYSQYASREVPTQVAKSVYGFSDTLARSEEQSKDEQELASLARAARYDAANAYARLRLVNHFNTQGVADLRAFLEDLKTVQRTKPGVAPATLYKLSSAERYFRQADVWLAGIKGASPDIMAFATQSRKALENNLDAIKQQRQFWSQN